MIILVIALFVVVVLKCIALLSFCFGSLRDIYIELWSLCFCFG